MREIKFRGKRVDNGEWVEGFYFESFTGIPYIMVLHDHILKMTEYYQVVCATVGQYTGLKDAYGTEIYEGDIIRIGTDEQYHIEFWDKFWNAYVLVDNHGVYQGLLSDTDVVEIMGNIHEEVSDEKI